LYLGDYKAQNPKVILDITVAVCSIARDKQREANEKGDGADSILHQKLLYG